MIAASKNDKERILDILATAFENDPHANWFTDRGDEHKKKRLRALMNFVFEDGITHQKTFLSEDRNAVAIWKTSHQTTFTPGFLKAYMHLALKMGIKKIKPILDMEKAIKARHPKKQDFLYLWFLGVHPNHQGKGLSLGLLKPMLKHADEKQLPVYLETTNSVNFPIYHKKGFEIFDQWTLDKKKQTVIYFMKRMPYTNENHFI